MEAKQKMKRLQQQAENKEIAKCAWEANLRIEAIFSLAGWADCEVIPEHISFEWDEILLEVTEQAPEIFNHHAYFQGKEWKGEEPDNVEDDDDWEELTASERVGILHERGYYGFLVQAATPVPMGDVREDRGYTFSWGHFYTQWFYTEAVDSEFMERVVQWKESMLDKHLARQKQESEDGKDTEVEEKGEG